MKTLGHPRFVTHDDSEWTVRSGYHDAPNKEDLNCLIYFQAMPDGLD